ncbi:hypothetical protein [Marinobacter similis]|uniref:Single-stranded DNA-binding protein BPT7 domain-containing protein n=1 Tax=Marinobacter similis TaxID=1420916 RepID=W5YMW3_9GAMM|nr:hypothetical protein [Marinobacter similis]AHI30264.1 hypothetical protein AU14_17445 [Marinobacter similis]
MASKFKFKTTPKGVANYPWLTRPDTKYDEEGEYKVNLVCPLNEESQAFIDFVEEEYKRHVEITKAQLGGKKPKEEDLGYDVNQDDGTVTFKIKMKRFGGKGEKRFEKNIAFFDATGTPIKGELTIKPGAELKISCRLFTWYVAPKVGLRMEPAAVQVISLGNGTGVNGSRYGFEEEEGGYVAPSMDNPEGYTPQASGEPEGQDNGKPVEF